MERFIYAFLFTHTTQIEKLRITLTNAAYKKYIILLTGSAGVTDMAERYLVTAEFRRSSPIISTEYQNRDAFPEAMDVIGKKC